MTGIVVADLEKRYQFPEGFLDEECTGEHIREIALVLDEWELLATHLRLSKGQIEDIKRSSNSQEVKRKNVLSKWKETHAFIATYRRLLEALLAMNRADLACTICQLVVPQQGHLAYSDSVGLPHVQSIPQRMTTRSVTTHHTAIKDIQNEFCKFVEQVEESFNEGVPLVKLQRIACHLPVDLKGRFGRIFGNKISRICRAKTTSELFTILSYFWDYLHPDLLLYLVGQFHIEDTMALAAEYERNLSEFRKQVKILDYIGERSINLEDEDYTPIVAIFGNEWYDKTLADLEEVQHSTRFFLRLLPKMNGLKYDKGQTVADNDEDLTHEDSVFALRSCREPYVRKTVTEERNGSTYMSYKPKLKLYVTNSRTTTVSTKPLLDSLPENLYLMRNNKEHGVALIINNKTFDDEQQAERDGTGRDEYNLVETFRYLGYRVEVRHQCTKAQIEELFDQIDGLVKDEDDSFVCCLLCHGKENAISGTDNQPVYLRSRDDSIERKLMRCGKLENKPKLFFVSACRGAPADGDDGPKDFIFCYSTQSGVTSRRDPGSGSHYINRLCRIFCESATRQTLYQMHQKVSDEVKNIAGVAYKQVPQIERVGPNVKEVYFFHDIFADDAESQKILEDALREGYVTMSIIMCLLLGMAGVGKTCLKHLLLGLHPPPIRNSTACAEKPTQVHIRSVAENKFMVKSSDGTWKEAKEEDMLTIIAQAVLFCERITNQDTSTEDMQRLAELVAETPRDSVPPSSPSSPDTQAPSSQEEPTASSEAIDTIEASDTSEAIDTSEASEAIDTIRKKLEKLISELRESGAAELKSETSHEDSKWAEDWVYLTDCGGQPQFQELLPLFVRNTSAALLVYRIYESLAIRPSVKYYKKGEPVGVPRRSTHATIETLNRLVNSIQSCRIGEKQTKVIVVGTHKDVLDEKIAEEEKKQQKSTKVIVAKNEEMLRELSSRFSKKLKFVPYRQAGSEPKVTFPVNTKSRKQCAQEEESSEVPPEAESSEVPPEADSSEVPPEGESSEVPPEGSTGDLSSEKVSSEVAEDVAKRIRSEVETSIFAVERKVPIRWYVFERMLRQLAISKNPPTGVLSRSACLEIARGAPLRFPEKVFDRALEFFDDFCILHYYPDTLPEVVFVNSQIPVDKVTELVEYSFKLRQPGDAYLFRGDWEKFKKEGIISLEILENKEFGQHYVTDPPQKDLSSRPQKDHSETKYLFGPPQLLKLLKKLLIVAPISLDKDAAEYFMPSLLPSEDLENLEDHRVFLDTANPLLFQFPDGSPRAGVFCCTVVHLMKHSKWEFSELSEDKKVARNCIKFKVHVRDLPCDVTLIDSYYCIEVHVETDIKPDEFRELFPAIQKSVFEGIEAARDALRYTNTDKPELAFFCPQSANTKHSPATSVPPRHIAVFKTHARYLKCKTDGCRGQRVNEKHKIWIDQGIQQSIPQYVVQPPSSVHVPQSQMIPQYVVSQPLQAAISPSQSGLGSTQGSSASLRGDSSCDVLDSRQHFKITKYLDHLPTEALVALGQALGLARHKLVRMKDMPGDMVAAWLRQEERVIQESGDPTWSILADKLDYIKQCGTAQKIRRDYSIATCSAGFVQGDISPVPSQSSITGAASPTPSQNLPSVSMYACGKWRGDLYQMADRIGISKKDREVLNDNCINEAAFNALELEDLAEPELGPLSLGGKKIIRKQIAKRHQMEAASLPPSNNDNNQTGRTNS